MKPSVPLFALILLLTGCMESAEPDKSSDASDEAASVHMETHDVEVEEAQ